MAFFRLSRLQLATLALALCCMPWLRGGRDAAGLVVIYACLMVGFFLAWRLLESHYFRISKLALWAIAFGLYGATSILWSVNRYVTVVWIFGFGLALLAALLAGVLATSKGGWAVFERAYLEIAAIVSLIGIWLFMTADYDRLTSLFYWANPAATFLLPAVFIATWRFVKGRGLYSGLLATVISSAFVLTFSRAASLVFLASMILFLAWEKPKKAYWINFVFIVFASLLLVRIVGQVRSSSSHSASISQATRFKEAIKGESTSLDDRLYYLRSAVAIWRDYPLLGSGAGSFPTMHTQYQYRVISAGSNTHNVYAQWVSELGLMGAVLLIGLLYELLTGLYRRAKQDPALRAAVCGLVAMLLHLGFDIGASFPAVLMLAAILIGYLYQPGPVAHRLAKRYHIYWPVAALMIIGFLPLLGYYRSLEYAASAQAAQDNGDLTEAAGDYQAAHLELVYNPDTLTGEGINDYVMATNGFEPKLNLLFARLRAETAIKQDPHDAQQWFFLGRVARAQGDIRVATDAYVQALRLDRYNHPMYYSDLADYYVYQKHIGLAIELATSGLKLYPPEVLANRNQDESLQSGVGNLYISRAKAYIQDDQLDLARLDITSALKADPANTSAKRLEAILPAMPEQPPKLLDGAGQSLEY